MTNLSRIVLSVGLLLLVTRVASAQEGEDTGTVSGTAEVSATGDASLTPPPAPPPAGSPGKLGIGGTIVLSGVGGLEGVYHVSDKLMVGGALTFASFSPDMGDGTTSVGLFVEGFYNLFDKSWADLYAGARLGYLSGSAGGGAAAVDASAIVIEIPLRIEIQLHRRLSLHFETGLAIDLVSVDGAGGDTSVTVFALGAHAGSPLNVASSGGGDIFATGGFTFYL